MPPEQILDMSVSDEIRDEQENPLDIESPGSSSGAAFNEDLNTYCERQLTDFPECCTHNIKSLLTYREDVVHSTTIMQRHLMPPLVTPEKNNKYSATAAKFVCVSLRQLA